MKRKDIEFDAESLVGSVEALAAHVRGERKHTLRTRAMALPEPIRPLMIHRHLNHQELTLAAIDDVISRGNREDWAGLREAVLADKAVLKKVLAVCRAQVADPRAQRDHFWMHYAEEHVEA